MGKDQFRKTSLFPRTLAQCVEPLTRPVLKTQGLAGSRILTEWPSVVGQKLANHCIPQKISFPPGKKTGGTLTIAVENGFAPEIQHQQPVILERLAGYFGYQAITRISISHTFLPASPAVSSAARRKPAAPLPPDIETMAGGVADDELRETLRSLARTLSKPST